MLDKAELITEWTDAIDNPQHPWHECGFAEAMRKFREKSSDKIMREEMVRRILSC